MVNELDNYQVMMRLWYVKVNLDQSHQEKEICIEVKIILRKLIVIVWEIRVWYHSIQNIYNLVES